ncbi:hypothetical protein DPMN_159141 [Dreissena polymorpha]|uniref:Uncharacterized protein n=1 Tax=Dreissena polymorpha TaxID=45954 RepID=A0A9D4EIJ4_DREPO|nr:hypothetical protein DPMN_159141 [Dreissena polymorpha]
MRLRAQRLMFDPHRRCPIPHAPVQCEFLRPLGFGGYKTGTCTRLNVLPSRVLCPVVVCSWFRGS